MPGPIHWLVAKAEEVAEQLQNVLSLKERHGQMREKNKDFVEPRGLKQSIIWQRCNNKGKTYKLKKNLYKNE